MQQENILVLMNIGILVPYLVGMELLDILIWQKVLV